MGVTTGAKLGPYSLTRAHQVEENCRTRDDAENLGKRAERRNVEDVIERHERHIGAKWEDQWRDDGGVQQDRARNGYQSHHHPGFRAGEERDGRAGNDAESGGNGDPHRGTATRRTRKHALHAYAALGRRAKS